MPEKKIIKKVLIAAQTHPYLADFFSAKGWEVILKPKLSREELLSDFIHTINGLVITTRIRIDREVIDKAIHLAWIGRLGSGLEHLDTAYLSLKKIPCIATPEGNSAAVAEHVLGLLLALLRNICVSGQEVKNKCWEREKNRGEELLGKTMGIIGYGHTGGAFGKIMQALGVRVLAYDKYKSGFSETGIEEVNLSAIFKEADMVSLHLPLTEETKYYANKDFFNQLQKSIYFLNASRGKIVHTEDLLEALRTRQVKAAALDVLENENLDRLSAVEERTFRVLSRFPNVIITPHIAGYSNESLYKMATILTEKLTRLALI